METCDAQGRWVQTESCAQSCQNASCSQTAQCTPGAQRCSGNKVEICNSSGTAWLHSSTCAVSCANGLCTGGCRPGERRCNAKTLEECNGSGTAWTTVQTCQVACDVSSTTCALASLEVTMANTPFDGVVVVNGPVTVRSGASIISNTGDLTIRASSITVENGAAINVVPTGNHPDGRGSDGYYYAYYYYAYGGSGGGYGTQGGSGYSVGGNAHGSGTDAVVTVGSSGGRGAASSTSVTGGVGGKGGGVLRLIAEQIDIAGQLNANGQNGGPGNGSYTGGGGGGSGGGILLAADRITISGSVSAAPGSGGAGGCSNTSSCRMGALGGEGRVKILHGMSKVVTGTVAGAKTEHLLPPLTITSSTHPDSSLTYNDDFQSLSLSWNRPFASRQGYYWLLDRTFSRVPTPATAQFTPNEAVTIPASALQSGANHFHIATVDATSTVGTVENRFTVNINTAPPSVSSSSHPSQTAWSSNNNVFFSWTLPLADRNFQGVYYVLDRYGTTVPTKSDTFLPVTQKQLLLSNLQPGIWVFHVVSVDQQGYLTKQAGHYRVSIGTDPGNGGILGRVVDQNGAAVPSATVTVNRGLYTQSTNTTGNYNFGSIPAGTWEVTVTKTGFQPSTKQVTVAAGQSASADFTLTP